MKNYQSVSLNEILVKLDLRQHVEHLEAFFSRPKSIVMEGDQERHFRYIQALDRCDFQAPPKSVGFEIFLQYLRKQGVLRFEDLFEIIKIIRYFRLLQTYQWDGILGEWMENIRIPPNFSDIDIYFDTTGKFLENNDEELNRISIRVKSIKQEIADSIKRLLHTQKITPYLVDTQIHYIHDEECLLLRGGFNHVLKGSVVDRTASGFFYVAPDSVLRLKEQLRYVLQEREALLYEYIKKFSIKMGEMIPFIQYIDREFDRFDHYQARIFFARSNGYSMIKSEKHSDIILEEFSHPALHNPKPTTLAFRGNLLLVTGVNAGGKTMLLKSILSSVLMAKYLIPMKLNPHKSSIGSFKKIEAVIDDPQNVRNDISTFAGRMVQFSHLFTHKEALIGVDEIELGTDSDEAAALFSVVLDELIKRGQKIVVTTHHKRLAALMADRNDVTLLAALFDQDRRIPTYEFLQGIIGKSYAFETASRYGISDGIVQKAKIIYGENHEKLNLLIERGSELERELKDKNKALEEQLQLLKKQSDDLKEAKNKIHSDLEQQRILLRNEYDEAIKEAKKAARLLDQAQIHRQLNKAQAKLPQKPLKQEEEQSITFVVGQMIRYRQEKGTVISLNKKEALIEIEGMRLRVNINQLKPSGNLPKKPIVSITSEIKQKSGLQLDLHGLRSDEACERMDKFLSDALLQGFDEVLIYHGIGTGKLAYAVKEFLKSHPSVKDFSDAPAHMGGFGAKVVRL